MDSSQVHCHDREGPQANTAATQTKKDFTAYPVIDKENVHL